MVNDEFWINDIQLSIPPSQIQINRSSFVNSWFSLRTEGPQSIRSGKGIINLSFSVVFRGNQSINEKLRKIVAGLRSTPFAVIKNEYIENSLRDLDRQNFKAGENSQYKTMRPCVFGLSSMTFNTIQDQPDCIMGTFQFLWFNYLPYTPIWAYKTGDDFAVPGPITKSVLWQKFYEPYLAHTKRVDWPHLVPEDNRTKFSYREFKLFPASPNDEALTPSIEILNAIKNQPATSLHEWVNTVSGITPRGNNNQASPLNVVFDRYYKRLVDKGVINKTQKNKAFNANRGIISAGQKGKLRVVSEVLEKITPAYAQGNRSSVASINENKIMIDNAITELTKRRKQLDQWKKQDTSGWQDVPLFSNHVVVDNSDTGKFFLGGYSVMYRDRKFTIGSPSPLYEAGMVVENISITFKANLAIIPMAGYSYPTLQFLGGYEITGDMAINAINPKAAQLQRTYDLWENTELRFKRIPQGFRTINIENDFFQLFGFKEFLPKSLSTSTIPNQPNRSMVGLSMIIPAVDAATRLKDPVGEIKQEKVQSDSALRKEVWKAIEKNITYQERKVGGQYQLHFKVEPNMVRDKRNQFAYDKIKAACDAYNEMIDPIMEKIFKGRGSGDFKSRRELKATTGSTGAVAVDFLSNSTANEGWKADATYTVISNLSQDGMVGFIPGLERLQNSIEKRKKTGRDKNRGALISGQKSLQDRKEIAKFQEKYLGKAKVKGANFRRKDNNTNILANDPNFSNEGAIREYRVLLNELFQDYLATINAIIDEIIRDPRSLLTHRFKHLKNQIERSGLNKGLPAYQDFNKSLRNVGGFLDIGFNDKQLIDYDPDVYLWSPAYDGGNVGKEASRLLDPYILSQAQRHSLSVFEKAQGSVNDVFSNTYRRLLGGTSNTAPLEALNKYIEENGKDENGNVQMTQPLYNKIDVYGNASLEEDNINMGIVLDPGKLYSNFYTDDQLKQPIKAQHKLEHSTDLETLWGGLEAQQSTLDPNGVSRLNSKQPPQQLYSSQYFTGNYGQSTLLPSQQQSTGGSPPTSSANNSNNKLGVVGLGNQFDWNATLGSDQSPNSFGLVCPVASYNFDAENLAPRHAGQTNFSWPSRRKSIIPDWNAKDAAGEISDFTSQGFVDPKVAVKEFARMNNGRIKPLNKWSFSDYLKWSRSSRKKLAYLHKGVDLYGKRGTEVYSIADGKVVYVSKSPIKYAGLFIIIKHNGQDGIGFSRYLHLEAIHPYLKVNTPVVAGQLIGLMGGSGYPNTKPHLHFEIWAGRPNRGGTPLSPKGSNIPWKKGSAAGRKQPTKEQRRALGKRSKQVLGKDVNSTITSPIKESIKEFEKELIKGQAQRLTRAYPAFKLYFVEDDSGYRKRLAFDDFFSYNSIKSIRVIKSRKIAADTCIIELINLSGVLTNRNFNREYNTKRGHQINKPIDKQGKVISENGAIDNPNKVNTAKENPIASLMLQEGMQIVLDLGNSNDPDLLERVFVGQIQQVAMNETDDLITIVCQSYATELVQDVKGAQEPNKGNSNGLWTSFGFEGDATTGAILEQMISQPEVIHFGRWERGSTTYGRDLLTNKFQWVPNPADDNMFPPHPTVELDNLGTGGALGAADLSYVIFRTTIWDIFKELELRHPNFISSPAYYEDKYGPRMTYFFGLPNQLYFKRHPTPAEEIEQIEMDQKEGEEKAIHELEEKTKTNGVLAQNFRRRKNEIINEFRKKRLALARENEWIAPFRKYHLITSSQHIVQNNIKADARDVANTILINWIKEFKVPGSGGFLDWLGGDGSKHTTTIKLDTALPTEDIRAQQAQFPNIINEKLARMYGVSLLVRNMKDIYKGELITIGNPSITPYDVCFIHDEIADVVGPIEVEQVIHHISPETGFLTEIKPDMMVVASDWSLLSSTEALGIAVEGAMRIFSGGGTTFASTGSQQMSGFSSIVGKTLDLFGGFMARKIINFTQFGHPVILCPLLLNGREWSGGVPTRKIPTSIWDTVFGSFHVEGDLSFTAWKSYQLDKFSKAIGKLTGAYSTGQFFGGLAGNTIDE